MISKDTENIQVMVRVRPLNQREKDEGAHSCVVLPEDNKQQIVLDTQPEPKKFNFDYVADKVVTQDNIFHIVGKPVTEACLDGYNACIFAYGQTGAGKTFTMQGRGLDEGRESELRGLQPRVFDFLFALINQLKKEKDIEYLVKASYLEIYNEAISDLLGSDKATLSVREDIKKGVYVENLTEELIVNGDEAIDLLMRGVGNRHVGATKMNAESSRSHSVFSLYIQSRQLIGGMNTTKGSKLHFVDLAGSERQKQTQAAGDRLKEAANINKSLTVLGQVINTLVECSGGKQRHIPYRDSKLTFILKDSLGGNSRTFMIANISSAHTSFLETMSTLKFAQRAKQIKNKASVNEESSGNVEAMKKEIKKLKAEIEDYKVQIKDFNENPQQQKQQMASLNEDKLTPYEVAKTSLAKITPQLLFGSNTKKSRDFSLNHFTDEWNDKLTIFIENFEQQQLQQQQNLSSEQDGSMEIEAERDQNGENMDLVSRRMEMIQNFQLQKDSLVEKLKQLTIEPIGSREQILQSQDYLDLKKEFEENKHHSNLKQKELQHQLDIQQQQINDKQIEMENLSNKNQQLESQLSKKAEENKSDQIYYEEQMQKIKTTLQEEIDKKYQNKDELEKRILDLNLKCEQLQENLDNQVHELEKQVSKYEEKDLELQNINKEKEQQHTLYLQIQEQKNEISEKLFQLEKTVEEKDEQVDNLKIMVQELTASNQTMNLQNLELQECSTNVVNECENLKIKVEELNCQILQINENLDLEKEKLLACQQEVTYKQEEIDTVTQSLEYAESQLENKQKECKNLSINLTQIQQELTTQQQTHISEIQEISKQLTIQIQQSNDFKKDIQDINENLMSEQKKKSLLETEKSYLQSELKQIQIDFNKSKLAHEVFSNLCEENERKYQKQIEEMTSSHQKSEVYQQMLEDQNEEYKQQIDSITNKYNNSVQEFEKQQSEISQLEALIQEKNNISLQTQEQLQKLGNQIAGITQELLNLNTQNENLGSENQQLKQNLLGMQAQSKQQQYNIIQMQLTQQFQKQRFQQKYIQLSKDLQDKQNDKYLCIQQLLKQQITKQIHNQSKYMSDMQIFNLQQQLQRDDEYQYQQQQEINELKNLRNNDQSQISDLLQNSQSLCQLNTDLQNDLNKQKENIEKYADEGKQFKSQIKDIENQYEEKYRMQTNQQKKEQEILIKQNKEQEEKIQSLNITITEKNNQFNKLCEKHSEEIEELSSMVQKLQKFGGNNENYDKLKIRYQQLEHQISKQEEIHNKLINEKTQELALNKNLIRKIHFNKKEYEQKIDELNQDNQKLNRQNQDMLKKIKDYDTEKMLGKQKQSLNSNQSNIQQKNEEIKKLNSAIRQLKDEREIAIQKIAKNNKNISQSTVLKDIQENSQLKQKLNLSQTDLILRDQQIKKFFDKIEHFVTQNMTVDGMFEKNKQEFYKNYKKFKIPDQFHQQTYDDKFKVFMEYIENLEKQFMRQYLKGEKEKSLEQYNLLKQQKRQIFNDQQKLFSSPSVTTNSTTKSQNNTPSSLNQKRLANQLLEQQDIQENINPNIQQIHQKKLKHF